MADIDAFGAAVGIYRIATVMNKKANIVLNDVTSSVRPMMERFLSGGEYPDDMFVNGQKAAELVDPGTMLVVVDVNRPSITDEPSLLRMVKTIDVDYEIPVGRLKEKDILNIGEWIDIWGNTLPEPIFAITDIYVNLEDINLLGSKKNIIKINKKIGNNNINFIKFFSSEDEYNRMIKKSSKGLSKREVKKFKIDIIGKFKINKFDGVKYPQIEIIDYNIEKIDRPRF